MDRENPFETHFREYDAWFDANRHVFESELLAIRAVLPSEGFDPARAAEIGVGSGRFAAALGVPLGVEPADGIASLARARGVTVLKGVAEALPFDDASLDVGFLITVVCFLKDLALAFAELHRVLSVSGTAIVAFVPADSTFGRFYAARPSIDPFFRHARMRTRAEVVSELKRAGFLLTQSAQTLCDVAPARANEAIQTPRPGWDVGSFVVLRAARRSPDSSQERSSGTR